MKELVSKHTTIYQFESFGAYHETRHFISSRIGGKSQGPFAGFNLGFGTDDNAEDVLQNRYLLSETLGVPLDWFVFPRQTHSANIAVIDKSHSGKGAFTRDDAIPDTDALICNIPHIFIVIQVADCVPVLLLDTENKAIAAIHAGWRGTVQEIVPCTIDAMNKHYGTKAENIIAGIGPSIGKCCYNVGEEVKEKFSALPSSTIIFENRDNNLYLDLWTANKKQLIHAGVPAKNIEIAETCTQCNHEMFFSSRHGRGNTGRFTAGIMLM